jgi:uncharacterized OsmC-like protein
MKAFPHDYAVSVSGSPAGDLKVQAARLPVLLSEAPQEFGGPGDRWSPETLLVAAVADCFVLTFRAVAARMELPWTSVRCEVSGTVDRRERQAQFTEFSIHVHLALLPDASADVARRALEKSKDGCLIANSLKAVSRLEIQIETVGLAQTA